MFCFRFMIIVVLCRSFVLGQGPEGVQLVGGSNQYKGRVEVSYNGHWATVCDKNFDKTDALFICRGLGLENVETIQVFKDLRYGQGTGLVITDLGCTGDEPNLHQCLKGQWDVSTCKHSEDVALDCQTPVYLEGNPYSNIGEVKVTVNGANYSVCSDVFSPREAEVTCRMLGFSTGNTRTLTLSTTNSGAVSNLTCTGQEADISDCGSNPLAIATCSDVAHLECRTAIRLLNGPTTQSGRVEIFYNDEWGTVCDDSFDDEDAAVVCRTLGFNPLKAISYGSAYYGSGSGSIIINELECNGDEPDVSQCRSNSWLSHTNCDHGEDAGVECLTEVRLADGPTHTSGRIEIKQGIEWFTFCDKDFNNNTATVICNMLGYRQGNVTVHKGTYYGSSQYDTVDYTPMCHGNETDVIQCPRETRDSTCSTNSTAGINCYSVTPIRLAGGWKSLVGKVELFSMYDKSWLSLCHQTFSLADAQVVCSMLGKRQSNPIIVRANGFYNFIIRGYGLHEISCTGNESDISDCLSPHVWGSSICGYTDFVGLNCEPVTPIRLVDGPSILAGRVELMYNNTWGRVCGSNLDPKDMDVLCRMLGATHGCLTLPEYFYPDGNGLFTVTNLQCVGTEVDVSNCRSDAWLSSSICSSSTVGIAFKTPIRLVNGSNERSGRVEVYHNYSWRSICADAVNLEVANVICRGVGFRFWNVTVLVGSQFGEGPQSILNNLTCLGHEADISMCRGGPWTATTCSQGTACVDCKTPVTPIRLVNTGITPFSGEVEVYYNNTWGTISFDGITKETVDMFCLNLGYNFSRDSSSTRSRYGCFTHMIDNLACNGNETDVSECPSDDWGIKACYYKSYTLKINCLTPISLLYGRTEYMGKVQMTHNNNRGSICGDGFTEENGRVICSMLGYNYTRTVQLKENIFNYTINVLNIVDGLNCSGDEMDINLCPSNPWTFFSNCSEYKAIGINCNTPVRLTDGQTPRVGKVQVMINGTWARVCNGISYQSANVGRVVCRELGYYTRQVQIYKAAADNETTYSIVCLGHEADISLCQIDNTTCTSDEVLVVACGTPLKLVWGRTKYMGQVEVSVSETGGISSSGLSDTAANDVCRILGYNFTRIAMLQSREDLRYYYYYTRTVVDRLNCLGNESDISDCIYNFENWQNRGVYSYDNMKINCQTPLRVVSGQPYIHGEVQMFSNNTWMSICVDEFTTQDAYVVCRMMGHSHVRNATIYHVTSNDDNTTEYLKGGFQCTGDEEDISQCNNLSWDTELCYHRVNLDCRTSARIVDGPTPYEGRIELLFNDTWLPICSHTNVNYNPAKILCRMAGFIETSPGFSDVVFRFNDSLLLGNLHCFGTENTISECSSSEWAIDSCSSSSLKTIACYTPIRIVGRSGSNRYNGRVQLNPLDGWRYICADSFDDADANVMCNMLGLRKNGTQPIVSLRGTIRGYSNFEDLHCLGHESDVQGCNHSNWKISTSLRNVAAVNCQPVTPARLVGGPNNASGRIEVFYNGQWGTVCLDAFDNRDAYVFCTMLGYKTGLTSYNMTGSGIILIDDLSCTGAEVDVSECQSVYWGEPKCSHTEEVAAIECSDMRINLTNGNNMYRGHVELQFVGWWHTVCSDHLNQNDTDVICRELGVFNQSKATIYNAGVVPQSNDGSYVIQDLMCDGSEDVIDECSSYPWTNSAPFCLQPSVAINCRPHTPIRLVGGPDRYSGAVEVEYPVDRWSTICDYDFDEQDAQVICRSLGYNNESVGVKLRSYYGYQSLPASISHLNCSSSESDISECDVGYKWGSPYAYCDSTRQAGVQCNTPVRISGGRTKYSGLLEVYYQNAWGTVCGEGFDLFDAQTVCNILGLRNKYNGSIVVNKGAFYGKSLGHVLLKNLNCTGDEGDLYECGTLEWMNNNCSHDQDVILNCRATTELRLMNGDNEVAFDPMEAGHVEGRVEVFYDGQWGTICNDHFDDDDAFVLCSMKGYIAGIYRFNIDTYGPGTGPITVDDLYCTGDESDLSECWSTEWRVHDCGHEEDVVIECYYEENPDPCNKFNHRPLSHLESRYVNFNTEGQDTAFNDSRLATRWYNVGNEVMPNYAPKVHSCGTTYPVYLTGSIPGSDAGQVDRVACQVTNDSDCGHTYNISIKLCPDSTYVYRLGPTVDEKSGYCFGIGSEGQPPDFVPTKVEVTRRPDTNSFVCDFLAVEADLFYSVIWQIQSDQDIRLTKGYCNGSNMTLLDITEEDLLNRTIKIGFKLVCSVRAYMVPGGPPGRLSDPSPTFFAGIQILTPSISMRRGETKTIEFKLTVPFSCVKPGCTLDLMSFTPDYGNCQRNSLSFSSGSCGLRIKEKDAGSIQHLDITSAETGQYGISGSFQVFLQSAANANISPLWKDIKLPAIEVKILPEADRKWRGRLCAARNDPHMYTFDGRQYEHHVKGTDQLQDTKGTFILYKNIMYGNDVEIQHRVTPCTTPDNPAMCNCGVAVRAGRDVYVISVCDSLIDIGYKHCGDNSLTVKKEDDTTYTVYLPYGTAVRARIDIQPWMGPEGGMALDISVNPSVYDQEGNSRGLCGTLDGDPENDFQYTDVNGTTISIEGDVDFINSWKVNETESLFSQYIETMAFKPWLFPVCVCNNKKSLIQNILPCKSSIQTCTPGVSTGTHSCFDVSSRRSVRSIGSRPLVPVVPIPTNFIAKQRSKRAVVPSGPWTYDLAGEYCNQVFSESSTFSLCQKVPFTHTNLSLDNCVLDILLTNSTEWLELTLQSMQDSCISTVMKNTTVRQEIAENVTADGGGADVADPIQVVINSIIEEFAVTCKFDCNDNGICNNGTCECYEGFGGSDCSVNTTRPPGLVGVLDNGLCDEANSTCDVIYGFGGIFLSQRLTCRLRKGIIDIDGNEQLITTIVTEGQAETLVEVMCPVPIDTQYVDDPPISTTTPNFIVSSFVIFYDVSVSNTGEYSDEQRVYVYDSTCQTYMIDSSNNFTFSVKAGTCRIERSCYISGETNPLDVTLLCDPQQSDHQWTSRNESSTQPTTSTSTSTQPTTSTSTTTEPTTSTSTPTEPTTSTSTSTEPTTSTSTSTEPTTSTSTSTESTTSTNTSIEPTTSTSTSTQPTTSTSTSTKPTTSTSTSTEPTTSTSTSIEPTISTSTSTEPTTSTITPTEPTTSTSTSTEPTTSTSTSTEPTTSTSTTTEPKTSTSTSTEPTTSTSTVPTFDPAVTRRSDLVLILIYNATDDLNDENVQMDYRNKAHKAITTRYETWFSEGSLKHIIVTGVRKGSLIIDHTLFTDKTSVTDSQLIKLMNEGISTINFSGEDIEVEKLELGLNEDSNNLLCEIHANINTCECELVNGNPTCVIGDDRTSIPVVVTWVSAVSGVVVILTILIAVVVVCRHKYLKLKRKSELMSTNSADNTWTPNWIWTTIPKRGHYSIGSPESALYNYKTGIDGCRLPRLVRNDNGASGKTNVYT